VSRNFYNRGCEWTKMGDIQTFNCPTAVGNQAEKGQGQPEATGSWILDREGRRIKDGGWRMEDGGWRMEDRRSRIAEADNSN